MKNTESRDQSIAVNSSFSKIKSIKTICGFAIWYGMVLVVSRTIFRNDLCEQEAIFTDIIIVTKRKSCVGHSHCIMDHVVHFMLKRWLCDEINYRMESPWASSERPPSAFFAFFRSQQHSRHTT